MARPRKEITEEHIRQIEFLSGLGLTEASIACSIGISPRLFRDRKHEDTVSAALEKGKVKAESIIGQALFNKAKSGDLGAIVWWEKTRAGRVDSSQVRHANADGGNLPLENLTDDQRIKRVTTILSLAQARKKRAS